MENFSITFIIVLAIASSIVIMYKAYRKAKDNDGKITSDEVVDILLAVSVEVNKVLKTIQKSSKVDKQSKVSVDQYVSAELDGIIKETPVLTEKEKSLLLGFGTDNIAHFITKYDKIEDAKKLPIEK